MRKSLKSGFVLALVFLTAVADAQEKADRREYSTRALAHLLAVDEPFDPSAAYKLIAHPKALVTPDPELVIATIILRDMGYPHPSGEPKIAIDDSFQVGSFDRRYRDAKQILTQDMLLFGLWADPPNKSFSAKKVWLLTCFQRNWVFHRNDHQLVEYAAEKGFAPAIFDLSQDYLHGRCKREQDTELGIKWLRLAAAKHHAEAEAVLGVATYYGRHGLSADQREGHKLLERAAKKNHPLAYRELALIYESDKDSENNTHIIPYLRASAQSGDLQAQFVLAKQLVELATKRATASEQGKFWKEGIGWMQMAADREYFPADLELATWLIEDKVMHRSVRHARWYEYLASKNVDSGNTAAFEELKAKIAPHRPIRIINKPYRPDEGTYDKLREIGFPQ